MMNRCKPPDWETGESSSRSARLSGKSIKNPRCHLYKQPIALAAPDAARTLRGDLDNIVLMAMRKEPARRYASVSALSNDLQAVRAILLVNFIVFP